MIVMVVISSLMVCVCAALAASMYAYLFVEYFETIARRNILL